MTVQDQVVQAFEAAYGESPSLVIRAPGRVNIIGEHTDYNDGFVLPMAINRAIWMAIRPREDGRVYLKSLDFNKPIEFSLHDMERGPSSPAEYVKGVAWAMGQAGHTLKGWEGILKGNVPIGAGLSSSAALEMATARAFASVSDIVWDSATMAQLAQKAENDWVGMNCGIMDQMISAAGKQDHALLIDCRSLETQVAPLPPETVIVILDTGTRRGLVDSAYNERREQCETAARFFEVPALRDVDLTTFEQRESGLDDVTRRRARHVITENDRTLQAKEAMDQGDASRLGALMNASHVSMRDDFEISSMALDAMVEIAQAQPGCYGARMTGGGFAGCAVALVQAGAAEDFAAQVETAYRSQTEHQPQIYICQATDGADIVG